MKKGSQKLSIVLIFTMVLSMIFPVIAEIEISDIENHWANATISKWEEKGLINGNDKGLFRPDVSITRAEFLNFFDGVVDFTETSENKFSDVHLDDWYYDVVNKASTIGLVNGYPSGEFRPDAEITREEIAVVISKYMGYASPRSFEKLYSFSDGNDVSDWAKNGFTNLISRGYYSGYLDNTVKPKNNLTRAEAIALLNNLFGNISNDGEVIGSEEVHTIDGNITISKADTTLHNIILNGDLLIANGVDDGEIYLDNVVVNGDVIVKAGGINSIYFNDVKVNGTLLISKFGNEVRIVVSGSTEIVDTIVKSNTILVEEVITGAGFEIVTIPDYLESGIEVVFDGEFAHVNLERQDTVVRVSENSTINKITASITSEGSLILGEGTVLEVIKKTNDITIDPNTAEEIVVSGDNEAPSGFNIIATDINKVRIEIIDESSAAKEYDLSLFRITEKYGSNEELEILSTSSIDGQYIYLNTEEMSAATVYEISISSGFADEWGNETKEDMTEVFIGEGQTTSTEDLAFLAYTLPPHVYNDGIYIFVDFKSKVGDEVLDIHKYSVTWMGGPPSTVKRINDTTVRLTISKTFVDQKYQLSISRIYTPESVGNINGMVSVDFLGGRVAEYPRIDYVRATDKQTIRFEFLQPVDVIKGLTLDNLTITGNHVLDLSNAFMHTDVDNEKVCIVTLDANEALVNSTNAGRNGTFKATFVNTDLEPGYNTYEFGPNNFEVTPIKIDKTLAVDPNNIKITFNQPVRFVEASDIEVDLNGDGAYVAVQTTYASSDDYREWILVLPAPMAATHSVHLSINKLPNISIAGDGLDLIPFGKYSSSFSAYVYTVTYIYHIYGRISDPKELTVTYPEAMNKSDVEKLSNYSFDNLRPIAAKYDETTYKVILTFDSIIEFKSSEFVVAHGIRNLDGSNYVNGLDAPDSDLVAVAYGSSYVGDSIQIREVDVDGQMMSIRIGIPSKSNVNIDNDSILNFFDITINDSISTTFGAISSVEAEYKGISIPDTTKEYFNTLIINFSTPLLYRKQGGIRLDYVSGQSDTLTNVNSDNKIEYDIVEFVQY